MSVQHQGPCAVSIRELWQQIEEMKATIAKLKTTLRDDRVSVNEQIDSVVDELEREGRRRVSLSSRLSKQAFKVAQVQIMNEYQGIRLLFVRLRRLRLCAEEVRQLLLPLGRRRFAAAITPHRVDTNDLLERSTG